MDKSPELFHVLTLCPLFRGLKGEDIERIFSEITYTVRSYAKGSFVIMRGDRYDRLHILIEGQVAAQMQGPSGKVVTVETLRAPDLLASAILFSPDPSIPVSVRTLTDTEILTIRKEELIRLFKAAPSVLEAYLNDMGSKVAILSEKFRLSQFSTIREKVAGFLLDQASKQKSGTVHLPYTKETLAEIFGVTRPALSRVFSQMEDEGAIQSKGRRVSIEADALHAILVESDS